MKKKFLILSHILELNFELIYTFFFFRSFLNNLFYTHREKKSKFTVLQTKTSYKPKQASNIITYPNKIKRCLKLIIYYIYCKL